MDESEVETACDQVAGQISYMLQHGLLPMNAWAFIRPIDVLGTEDKVVIWTAIASPN